MSRATAGGTHEYHKPTYDGAFKNSIQRLVGEVQVGRLHVCTKKCVVASANEVIEDAKRDGTYIVAVGDDALTMLINYQTKILCLNQWGAILGDTFSLAPDAPPWIDERGCSDRAEMDARLKANPLELDDGVDTWDEIEALLKEKEAAPAKPTNEPATGRDWRESAREIADECFDNDTNGTPPTRDSLLRRNARKDAVGGYAVRVMEKMQERGIHGPRGLITNAATISREALQGAKWWARKSK